EAFRGGWFHSGDLAVMHPDGYAKIKDRSKDVIISGGENISSQEVEDVLHSHPAVMMAAVVAQPDPKWGETPCAFVELKEGASASAEEVIEFCRARMARFKAPKSVVFGPLPKTSTGKIQKYLLREKAKSASAIATDEGIGNRLGRCQQQARPALRARAHEERARLRLHRRAPLRRLSRDLPRCRGTREKRL